MGWRSALVAYWNANGKHFWESCAILADVLEKYVNQGVLCVKTLDLVLKIRLL